MPPYSSSLASVSFTLSLNTHFPVCAQLLHATHYAGEKGIPTIGLGPSREDLAHTVDEYVELTQLFGGVECYYAVMEALLL